MSVSTKKEYMSSVGKDLVAFFGPESYPVSGRTQDIKKTIIPLDN